MIVNDGMNVRPRLIQSPMYEALEIRRPSLWVDRCAVQYELHDIVFRDGIRRTRTRQEVALRVFRVAKADMTERIDNAFARKNAIGGNEFVNEISERSHPRFTPGSISGAPTAPC